MTAPKMSEVFELPVTTLGLAYNSAINPNVSSQDVLEAVARAVNAHDALVEALKEATEYLEEIARQHHPKWRPDMCDKDSVLYRIYAALALAEGRS